MEEVAYFFDSYAIVEMVRASPKYARFQDCKITITLIHLAEVYWAILRDLGQRRADEIFDRFRGAVVEIGDETR